MKEWVTRAELGHEAEQECHRPCFGHLTFVNTGSDHAVTFGANASHC